MHGGLLLHQLSKNCYDVVYNYVTICVKNLKRKFPYVTLIKRFQRRKRWPREASSFHIETLKIKADEAFMTL